MKALGFAVSEKKIFKKFSYIFQCKKLTPGAGPFLIPGGFFQQHMWRTSRCCHIPNMKALGHVVSEKKIFKSFPIYFNVKLLTPGAGPFLTPGGFFQQHMWRTSICCHIPNMKALGFAVSEKKIFKKFSYIFQCKKLTPGAGPFLTPGRFFQQYM